MLSDIKAKKSLGQNFLINEGVLDKIIQAAEISPEDIVLEVGPGTGKLTKRLSGKAKRIVAVEKDRRLIEPLKEKFSNTNVEIIEGDVLTLEIEELFRNFKLETTERSRAVADMAIRNSNYKVIGNIPYYITSYFLRTIFEKWPEPKLIVLMIQKEVSRRIVAKRGEMNLLALSVQLYADPEIIMDVSKGSFRPSPKVDSSVIKLTPNLKADKETILTALRIAKKAFAGKRKQIKNTLKGFDFESLGVSPETRPEDLDISDWLNLASEV